MNTPDRTPVPPPRTDEVTVVGALAEPTRRSLYEFVADSDGWVSRDQAADAVALGRATAAHHLDRLVDAGLLEVDFRRLSDRSGPGAGRPAKLYQRAGRDFAVSLPPRDYELAGELLARAVDAAIDGGDVLSAVQAEVTAEGGRFATVMRERLAAIGAVDAEARRRVVLEVLAGHGYEPVELDSTTVVLRNCPFHRLSQRHTELVCGMNVRLLRSAVAGFGDTGFEPAFEPEEGLCCVRLRRDG